MDYNDDLKKKKKESPTSLNIGSDEETGNYYCPVDNNHNPIREKRKYIKAGEQIPTGWVQCD
ncbi:TPA: hypothetical protein I8005_001632 [Legionella pneumophila]|nr:hypothetical protein [Legionella pneumophila]